MRNLRLLSLALAISAGLTVTGCKEKTPAVAETPITKTLVVDSRLWSPPAEQEYLINHVFKRFEEENAAVVNFSTVDDPTLLERAKLQKATNHVTTDVVIAYGARFPEWVEHDYVSDLTPHARSWKDRTFSEGFDRLTVFDGKRFFAPIGADVYLLAVNKNATKYLSPGVEIGGLSWEEFVDWAIRIADGEGQGKLAWTGVPQKMLVYQFGSMVLAYGGGFPDINSDGALKAWEQFVRLKGTFTPAVRTYDNVVPAMKSGDAWLTVTHNARVGQIYQSDPSQFVIAPAPRGPAGIGSVAGTSGLAVVKGAPNQDLAIKFVEFMTRPAIMLDAMKGTGGFIPPVNEAVDLLGVGVKDEVISKSIKVLQQGVLSFVPSGSYGDWGSVKLIFDEAFYKLVLGEGRIDRVYLDAAADRLKALEQS